MPTPFGIPDPLRWHDKHQRDFTLRTIAFDDWLAEVPGDTLATASAYVSPNPYGGIVPVSVVVSGATVTVWMNGGIEGQDYVVVVTAVATPSGRSEDFPIQISVPVATLIQ